MDSEFLKCNEFKFKFYPRLFLIIVVCFILFTIVGTISHEYGHIFVAKRLGYETKLHYGSTSWFKGYNLIEKENQNYNESREKGQNDEFLITIGGPVQTISVGILGLAIVIIRKNRIRKNQKLNITDWVGIFLTLFWLRELFNLVRSIISGSFQRGGNLSDEAKISLYLNLPIETIPILSGLIGLLIVCYIVFSIIPKSICFTFILGGLTGGMCGFIFWFYYLGPNILP